MTLDYGPNTAKVKRFIKQIKNMSVGQMDISACAANACDAWSASTAAAAGADSCDAAGEGDAWSAAYGEGDACAASAYAYANAGTAAYYEGTAAYREGAASFSWYFGRAAAALTATHLIGKHGFTQSHFDLLTEAVWLLESIQEV